MNRYGPGCKCCGCNAVVTVFGCRHLDAYGNLVNTPLAGATFYYTKGGITSPTYTTNSSGQATIRVDSPGPALFTVTPPSGTHYVASTTTLTLACPNAGYSLSVGLDAGWSCGDDACCPTGGMPPYPIHTYPATLYLNDGFGMVALSNVSSGNSLIWIGDANRVAANGYTKGAGFLTCDAATNITIPIHYILRCGAGVGWNLTASGTGCNTFGSPVAPGTGGGSGIEYVNTSLTPAFPSTCPPALSLTLSGGTNSYGAEIWGSFSGTVTQ